MPTENRSNDAGGWIACDDGLHLIQMDKNLSHYGWVFRKIDGGLPYSVREATAHEMAHAQARQHLRIGVAQIEGQAQAEQRQTKPVAYRWKQLGGNGYMYGEELPTVMLGAWQELYTHPAPADAGEVERLREGMKYEHERAALCLEELQECESQRDEFYAEITDLRAKMAERDALLREAITLCRTNDLHISANYFESKLSARAEPSAHGNSQGQLDGSAAPAERDELGAAGWWRTPERDAFEEWAEEEAEVRGVGSTIGLMTEEHRDRYCMIWTQTAWMAWQARAALDRKP